MIRLERLSERDLTLADIQWLVHSCLNSFDGVNALEIVEAARGGTVGIHRISGDADGIIVFEQCKFNTKVGIKIIGIAGRNLIKNMTTLNDEVRVAARAAGAEFLWGMTGSPGLGRIYQRRATARKIAEVYIEDLV